MNIFLKVNHTLYLLKNHILHLHLSNIVEDDMENRMEALKNNGRFLTERINNHREQWLPVASNSAKIQTKMFGDEGFNYQWLNEETEHKLQGVRHWTIHSQDIKVKSEQGENRIVTAGQLWVLLMSQIFGAMAPSGWVG